jgi:hypothetical protein
MNNNWEAIEQLLEELTEQQHIALLSCGRQIIPKLTTDDILQPNDFPKLEQNPLFRYEEGMLAGIQTVHMALRALKNETANDKLESTVRDNRGTDIK